VTGRRGVRLLIGLLVAGALAGCGVKAQDQPEILRSPPAPPTATPTATERPPASPSASATETEPPTVSPSPSSTP